MTIFPLLYSSFTLLQILWNPAESFRGEWNTYCEGLPLAVRVTPAIHSRCAFSYQVLPSANIVIGEVTKSSVFSGISCYVYLALAAQQHCFNLILLENKRQPCLLVQDFRHVSQSIITLNPSWPLQNNLVPHTQQSVTGMITLRFQ